MYCEHDVCGIGCILFCEVASLGHTFSNSLVEELLVMDSTEYSKHILGKASMMTDMTGEMPSCMILTLDQFHNHARGYPNGAR